MTKIEAIENILSRIDEIKDKYVYEYGYGYIGVRVQENEFTDGEALDNSYIWIDGEITDEELDGTCAIKLDEAKLASNYFGDHVAIVGGDRTSYGSDLGELIIRNAKVLEVIA